VCTSIKLYLRSKPRCVCEQFSYSSKNHEDLLVPVPAVRSETGFVILSKFWSRYDLQHFRKRIFLGDGHGEGTVLKFSITKLKLVALLTPPRAARGPIVQFYLLFVF
jgi:hypothetical protein